jgi:KaiC/GvpD/RAD55 family RecA-like ATPase
MFDDNAIVEQLPFSVERQRALLGHLLTEPRLFAQAERQILPEWWADTRLGQVWEYAMTLAKKAGRAVSASEVSESQELQRLEPKETKRLQSEIETCLVKRADIGIDLLQAELTSWLHARIYIAAMKKSEHLFLQSRKTLNGELMKEAFETIRKMNSDIAETAFGGEATRADMGDPARDFGTLDVDAKTAISFGLPALDQVLLPEGGGRASLLAGDMTVLLSPTNSGKTTTMVTVLAHNIRAGKSVLLVTHEGRTSDIKMKIWQSLTGMTRQEVKSGLEKKDDAVIRMLARARQMVDSNLEFLPMNKAGQSVETVVGNIAKTQRARLAQYGHGFDLIVDDYAAKLTTRQAKGGQFQFRQIQEVVYNYFAQLALEHNCHVLTAIQANREASKINRGKQAPNKQAESRLLNHDDVSEAIGPMTTATNIITINRSLEDQANGTLTFFVSKSRSGETGWAVTCKSNFAACQSHGPNAPVFKYRGSSPMAGRAEELLRAK